MRKYIDPRFDLVNIVDDEVIATSIILPADDFEEGGGSIITPQDKIN